jgi:hypothetical protein
MKRAEMFFPNGRQKFFLGVYIFDFFRTMHNRSQHFIGLQFDASIGYKRIAILINAIIFTS